MKKLLIGCLVLVIVGAIGAAVASYFAYRAASPYIQQASDYARKASDYAASLKALPELDRQIANRAEYDAPASGELTREQVERFARVQERVRKGLGERVKDLEAKHAALRSNEAPSPSEALSALADFFGLFVDARRYQVEALNAERFSQAEYDWVRTRIYAAAGMHLTSAFDIRKIEEVARMGQSQVGLEPNFRVPEPPARNRELVKPYLDKMDEWLPLAFFGL